MAIFRIIDGKKTLIADVSKVKSVNGKTGDILLNAGDILMSGSGSGSTTVRKAITDLKNNEIQLLLSEKLLQLNGNILSSNLGVTGNILNIDADKRVIGTKPFNLAYTKSTGELTLSTTGGGSVATVNLDLESQIEWIGLVKVDNNTWVNFPSGYTAPTAPANGMYLVVVHVDAKDVPEVTYGDVSDLLDNIDWEYFAGNGLNLNDSTNTFSAKAGEGILVNANGINAHVDNNKALSIGGAGIGVNVTGPNLVEGTSILFTLPELKYDEANTSTPEGFYIDIGDTVSEDLNSTGPTLTIRVSNIEFQSNMNRNESHVPGSDASFVYSSGDLIIEPFNAFDKSINWVSSNPSICTVIPYSMVGSTMFGMSRPDADRQWIDVKIAVGVQGTATITGTANDGGGTTASFTVTVS